MKMRKREAGGRGEVKGNKDCSSEVGRECGITLFIK